MKLSQKQQEFALDVARLILEINNRGYRCTLGECYRTPEQAEIYAKSGRGIKNSLHTSRLAIDINLFDPDGNLLSKSEDHTPFGIYWESLRPENRSGMRFNDGNHYERYK